MARAEPKMIMGFLPIEERHYPALQSLVASASPAVRMLDTFAGEGAFLEAASTARNCPTPTSSTVGRQDVPRLKRRSLFCLLEVVALTDTVGFPYPSLEGLIHLFDGRDTEMMHVESFGIR